MHFLCCLKKTLQVVLGFVTKIMHGKLHKCANLSVNDRLFSTRPVIDLTSCVKNVFKKKATSKSNLGGFMQACIYRPHPSGQSFEESINHQKAITPILINKKYNRRLKESVALQGGCVCLWCAFPLRASVQSPSQRG